MERHGKHGDGDAVCGLWGSHLGVKYITGQVHWAPLMLASSPAALGAVWDHEDMWGLRLGSTEV